MSRNVEVVAGDQARLLRLARRPKVCCGAGEAPARGSERDSRGKHTGQTHILPPKKLGPASSPALAPEVVADAVTSAEDEALNVQLKPCAGGWARTAVRGVWGERCESEPNCFMCTSRTEQPTPGKQRKGACSKGVGCGGWWWWWAWKRLRGKGVRRVRVGNDPCN